VEKSAALAGHPIVTALGVGPYDLSADLGCCWHPENEEFQNALRQIRAAADTVDKKVWIGTDVDKYASEGYTFLWCGTFASVLTGALAQVVAGSNVEEGGSPPPA
jgi:2-keto-3-deoxy-L-rhamnonate aldolase RhmA